MGNACCAARPQPSTEEAKEAVEPQLTAKTEGKEATEQQLVETEAKGAVTRRQELAAAQAAAVRRRQMADPTTRQIALNAARNQQRAQRASTPPRSTAPTARKQPPSLDDVPAAHGRKQPPSLGHEPPALWKQPPSLGHAGHKPPALP